MLKLIKNDLSLIWFEPTDWTQPTRWEVFKKFKWFDYIHDNELLLVSFKKKFLIKQSKNLTRWDIIFLLKEEIKEYKLDEQWLIDWMTFHQKYNDDTQMFDAYAKWINKERIKDYEEILKELWLEYKVTKRWILLKWDRVRNLNDIYETLVSTEDLNYVFSFIYWLSVFYWRVQFRELEDEDEYMYLWFQVNFNFKDLWIDIDALVDKLKDLFKKNKMIINVSLNNTNLTISSVDYEFDKFVWKVTFWENAKVHYGRYNHAIKAKGEILKFVENWIEWLDNRDEALNLIENNYIKLIW